jgi:hypothetical protein
MGTRHPLHLQRLGVSHSIPSGYRIRHLTRVFVEPLLARPGCVEDVRTQMRASDVSGNKRKRRTKFSTVRLKRRARKFPQAEQTMETCTTNDQAVAPYDTSFEPCSDKRRALTNQCMRKSFDCETSHRILCVTNCTDQRSTDHVHGMRGGSRHRDVLAE